MSPSFKRLKSPSFWKAAGVGALAFMATAFAPLASADINLGDIDSPGSILRDGLLSVVPRPESMFDKYLKPGLVNITGIGVQLETPTRIRISANTSLDNPFGAPLILGTIGLNVFLDDQPLANLTAFNVSIGAGISPFNITSVIDLADGKLNPGLKTSMNNLVTNLVGGATPLGPPPKLVVNNISLDGVPFITEPTVIPTQFPPSKVAAPPPPPVLPLDGSMPPVAPIAPSPPPVVGLTGLIDPTINMTVPKLTKVIFVAETGATLKLGVGFDWVNPFNLELDFPTISVDIGLNSTHLVKVRIEQFHVKPGPMSAETFVYLTFNNEPEAAVQTAAFLNDFMNGMLTQTLNVGNITFGAFNGSNVTEINDIFSGININLPFYGVSTVAIKEYLMGIVSQYLPIDLSQIGGSPSSLLQYVKGLALKTAPGHTLLISPTIQIPLSFGLDVNVPYFALDLNLGGSRLAKLFIANLLGQGTGPAVDISLGIGLVFDEPNPTGPAAVASVVNGLITGAPIDVTAGFGNVAIGISPTDAVNTLNNINLAVPISSVIKGGVGSGDLLGSIISQTNVTVAQNAIAINVGTLVGLTIHEANIAILPSNHISAGLTLDMFLGLPIVADIGYFGVNLGLDGSQLAGIALNSRFAYGGGTAAMNMGLDISVGTGSEIASKVAALVNAIVAKQSISSSLGINGLVLGDSPSDTINALSQIAINMPLGGLMNGNAPQVPGNFLSNLIAQLGLKLSELSLATVPNAGLRVGAKAAFSNPIPVTLSVPYVGIAGGLDNVDIANVGVNNLALVTGGNNLAASVDFNFNNGEDAQQKVATFVGRIAQGQLGMTPETLTVHNLRLGASPSDYFDILSQISVSIPSASVINRANVDYITGLIGLNLAQLGGNLLDSVKFSQLSADLTKPPVIDLGTTVAVTGINLQADVQIGYFGIDLALDNSELAHVDVPQITIHSANNQLSLSIQAAVAIRDTPQLAETVGKLFTFFTSPDNTTPVQNLVISKPLLGVSASDSIQTFSLISYPVALPPLLAQAKTFIGGLLNGGNSTDLFSRIGLNNLVLDLNSPQVMGIDAGVVIKSLSLPAQIKLSYVGIDVGVDAVNLAQVSIPKLDIGSNGADLTIGTHVDATVATSEAAQAVVAGLFNAIAAGQVPQGNIVMSNLAVGGSKDNTFKFLQGIKLGLPLAKIFGALPAPAPAPGNPTDLFSRIGLNNLVIDLNSPQVMGIDAGVVIKSLSLPAQIRLNYVGIDVAVDTVNLAQVSIPKLELGSTGTDLTIATHVDATVATSEAAQAAVAGLFNAIVAGQVPQNNLVITNLAVGASKDNTFAILRGIKVNLPLAKFFGAVPVPTPGNSTDLLSRIGLNNLVIDLNSPQVVGIDAGVVIKSLSLPAQIRLNYVGIDVGVAGVNLAQVSIPKMELGSTGADLTIATHVDATLATSEPAQAVVSGLFNAILAGQIPQGNIAISNLAVGANKENTFAILRGIKVDLPLAKLFGAVPAPTPGTPTDLFSRIGLNNLVIDLNSPQVVGIDAGVVIKSLSLPAQIKLSYVGVDLGVEGVNLAQISVPKFELGSTGADLTIAAHVDAAVATTDAAQTAVAGLFNAIIAGQVPQGNIAITNLAIGANKDNTFALLRGIKVDLPLAKIFGAVPLPGGGNSSSILDKLTLNSANINMRNPPKIGADLDAALAGFSFDAKLLLNYVSVSAALDSTPLATIGVPSIGLSSGNNQVALKVQTLIGLEESGEIQDKVAAIVNAIMAGTAAPNANLVIGNIAFGGSAGNVFHILDKVRVSLPIAPYIKMIQDMLGGTAGSSPISITQLDLSAPGANELAAAVGVAIGGLGSKISVDMPYVGLDVTANGQTLIQPAINNMQLANGKINLNAALPFGGAAPQIIGSLSTPVSQLLFSSVGNVPGSIVASGIKFGASPSQAYNIAGKVAMTFQLNDVFQKAQAYINAHNPLHVNDMDTTLTTDGILAKVVVPGIPMTVPLKMNFPITVEAYHQGTGTIMDIKATSMELGGSPWVLGAGIVPVQPGFSKAMEVILPNALQWKNALEGVTMGGVKLGSFTALSQLMITPPPVTLWSPINIPLSGMKPHLFPLSLDMVVNFANGGPLQVDMGFIDILVKQGSSDAVQVTNTGGAIHINNRNQNGGQNNLSLNMALKFSLLQLLPFIIAMLNPSANAFTYYFNFKTSSGSPMTWMNEAMNRVPAELFNKMLPIIANAMKNVKFPLFGSAAQNGLQPDGTALPSGTTPTNVPTGAPTDAPAPTSAPVEEQPKPQPTPTAAPKPTDAQQVTPEPTPAVRDAVNTMDAIPTLI